MKKVIITILCAIMLCGCVKYNYPECNHLPSETELPYAHYIGNKESKKYHKATCSFLPSEKNQVIIPQSEINTAKYQKYTPCGHCKP